MPRRYQVKTYEVMAMQLMPDNVERVALWAGGVPTTEHDALDASKTFVALNIPTLEGAKRAQETNFILKSVDGQVTGVMSAGEFLSKFEPIPE